MNRKDTIDTDWREGARIRIIILINALFRKIPGLSGIVKLFWYRIWLIRTRFSAHNLSIDPTEVYYVDPGKINRFVKIGEKINKNRGQLLSGNWDVEARPLTDKAEFTAFYERFIEGKMWQDTQFYHMQIQEIVSGKIRSCSTRAEFDLQLKGIDETFNRIKAEGYEMQPKLSQAEGGDNPGQGEVLVAVSAKGEPIFMEGLHLLVIAKVLGLPKIPVRIIVRHKDWYEFKEKVLIFCKENLRGKSYSPINHFEFSNLPSSHDETRFELMRNNFPLRSGTLLDIGTNFGYLCHRFEEEGFDCTAVEFDLKTFFFLKKLKEVEGRRFEIINSSIFDYKEKSKFDVVLALNIFYHFLRAKDTYNELIKLLGRLETKFMFFQPIPNDMHLQFKKTAYISFNEDEFVEFILEHSKLNNSKLLGRDKDGRALYMLT